MRSKTYYETRAKEIISRVHYLTLATTSLDGTPWNSPLSYAVDKNFNFYFGSPKNTQHSQNII
ncbi:pyridoxamine 5'-phosphate oxidase family protein, partial [Candidatus Dojkabacteria bacterium]|nr:pyridoxamine 5'-phosphate oxidase family protein [Candidatus Dojkabacteria bacterium]